jgi:hypothetical protein
LFEHVHLLMLSTFHARKYFPSLYPSKFWVCDVFGQILSHYVYLDAGTLNGKCTEGDSPFQGALLQRHNDFSSDFLVEGATLPKRLHRRH